MWWFSESSFPLWKHLHLFQHTSIQISASIRYKFLTSNLTLSVQREGCTIESLDYLWNLFNTTENWGPMEHRAVDITLINAESLQQRGRKTEAEAALFEPRKNAYSSTALKVKSVGPWSESVRPKNLRLNNHDTVSSMREDDGIYIKVCSVIGTVLTERRDHRFYVTSAKHCKATVDLLLSSFHGFLYRFCICVILVCQKKQKLPQL